VIDVAYAVYVGGIIVMWNVVTLAPGPIRSVWVRMTLKERVASLLSTYIILILPADYLLEVLTLSVR